MFEHSETKCCPPHDYKPLGGGSYYKQHADKSETVIGPRMEQLVSYRKLYCRMCGQTKEIIHQDHRQEPKK